jgi:hypothetical protein
MDESTRAPVPEPVKRQMLSEDGYRCAIPHCMHSTTEIAHIMACEESKDNSPEDFLVGPEDFGRKKLQNLDSMNIACKMKS